MPMHIAGNKLFMYEKLDGGRVEKPKYRHYADLAAFFGEEAATNAAAVGVTKVIAMSDIHSLSEKVVAKLIMTSQIAKNTIVLMTGDMAGTGKRGPAGDANPFDMYMRVRDAAFALYFVQGNHDIEDPRAATLTNDDGSFCCVHNTVQHTVLGTIGGVNGIRVPGTDGIPARHKYPATRYEAWWANVQRLAAQASSSGQLDICLSHEPPANEELFAQRHLFGHAHAPEKFFYKHADSECLNMDSRVFLFQ
eukprot:m.356207 g.356207  ORF g.356207 m.356207 type:complete len:250 (+) comp17472_c0_seq1:189-938(+)